MKVFVYGLCAALAFASPSLVLAADAPDAKPADAAAGVVSPEVLAEMGSLVERAIQEAAGPLQTQDDFEPYAVFRRADGSMQVMRWQSKTPTSERPPAMEIFRMLNVSLLEVGRRDPSVVAAVTVAATSVPTTDGKQHVSGIRAEVDHRHGVPQIVFIPYARENGKLITGTPAYTPGTNVLFARETAQPAVARPAEAKPAATPAIKPATKPASKPAK